MIKYLFVVTIYMCTYSIFADTFSENVLSNYSNLNEQIQPILLSIDRRLINLLFGLLCVFILADLLFSFISVNDYVKYDTKYKIHFGSFIKHSSFIGMIIDLFYVNGKKSFLLFGITVSIISPILGVMINYKRAIKGAPLLNETFSFNLVWICMTLIFLIWLVMLIITTKGAVKINEKLMIDNSEKYKNTDTVFLSDLSNDNYCFLLKDNGNIEEDCWLIPIENYIKLKKKNSDVSTSSIVVLTDFDNYIKYDKDLKNAYDIYFQINHDSDICKIIVLDFGKNITSDMKKNIVNRYWIDYLDISKREGIHYAELFDYDMNNYLIKSNKSYLKTADLSIKSYRNGLLYGSDTMLFFNIKNYMSFIGLLLYYFILAKKKDNRVPFDHIDDIFSYIEENKSLLSRDIFRTFDFKDSKENKLEKVLKENNGSWLKWENTETIDLERIIYTVKVIHNKTLGHGVFGSEETIALFVPVLKIMLEYFEKIIDISSLQIEREQEKVRISYNGETVDIPNIDGKAPIQFMRYSPCILINKKRKNEKNDRLIRRNYLEGEDYIPSDTSLNYTR